MAHDTYDDEGPIPIDLATAGQIAQTMQALSTASRVLILGRLREGPCSVTELATAIDMEQSAVSHQLRLLRHLGLVVAKRQGRNSLYELHDDHVAEFLDEAVGHVQHVRLEMVTPPLQRRRELTEAAVPTR